MSKLTHLVNPRGDLFATGVTFLGQGLVKLGSSVILTRILLPEAYGVITILISITFIVAMLSDIGTSVSIVRDPEGEEPRYLNTAWTLRLIRAAVNGAIVLVGAPLFASLYSAPLLTTPLRVFSLWFIVDGFESTSFSLAIRRKRSRILMYCDLLATFLSAVFTAVYCYFSRTYWGMVYGVILNRLILVILSHQFYRELSPRLQLDRAAAREIFKYTRFVLPSSVLTLVLNQFDKAAFLRLFDLPLLGIYSLAGNIAGPIESLIGKASQMVLYPRCAHNYRTDRDSFSARYYTENARLFISILAVPAAVGGAAHVLVALLYDPRYAYAGSVLQAFMVRAALLSLASPAENMLIATGESRIILFGNVFRAAWMFPASLAGYYFFGFMGFTYGIASSGLPPLVYYLWFQRRKGWLIARYELYKVTFACAVALTAYLASRLLLAALPIAHVRI